MTEDRLLDGKPAFVGVNVSDGSSWVDLFVHEMMNATDLDDARGRAARILDGFERSITANSKTSSEVTWVIRLFKKKLFKERNSNCIFLFADFVNHGLFS